MKIHSKPPIHRDIALMFQLGLFLHFIFRNNNPTKCDRIYNDKNTYEYTDKGIYNEYNI